ncbi:hypothetical protein ACFORL_01285 [Legionella dresdenensis]|uniref:Inner membrane protein AmpE n=1 Tax=Legionella dresdenensis TaxID=450200 RepID=A0ABV8CBP0_9GAMM
MKLFAIVLCLLSERYLVHAASNKRELWFNHFFDRMNQILPQKLLSASSYLALVLLAVVPSLIVCLLVCLLSSVLYGVIVFVINLVIFYLCLGPQNIFYPVKPLGDDLNSELAAGNYFVIANNQLFAVILWFIVAGAPGALFYRLLYVARGHEYTAIAAKRVSGLLDWISARVTLMFYLLVGNFQQGFDYYRKMFLSSPDNNEMLLSAGGLLAARTQEEQVVSLPYAQTMVEQALIVYLVFVALFTLAAWM